jgi:hypothetical protein
MVRGPEDLQFRKAEHAREVPAGPPCASCSKPTGDSYYQANGKVVCVPCGQAIEAGQNAPPPHTLLKSLLYGLGAGVASITLYAVVYIVTGSGWALIYILTGFMVGKAIRYASNGLGGRPQQILAVVLTYFAITWSVVPVILYHSMQKSKVTQSDGKQIAPSNVVAVARVAATFIGASIMPFLLLGKGVIGVVNVLIIFFGLWRAWRLTGRSNILVMGPYQAGT